MMKLSVILATRNEEGNIGDCLKSVREIADEIVVVDEGSTDRTRQIAKRHGARVFKVRHEEIFHKTKQKALDKARGEWILQLDADERVTAELAREVREVVEGKEYKETKNKLFLRHQRMMEKRDGVVGTRSGEVVAYYLPRLNYFLGKPLVYAGRYPDGVIRLFRRGKARFPAKSVHEQIEVDGRVGWLNGALEHHDSPALRRYLQRLDRYTDLHASELKARRAPRNLAYLLYYSFIRGGCVFGRQYFRNKGILHGVRGFLWCALSASHYPIAYFKYYTGGYNKET